MNPDRRLQKLEASLDRAVVAERGVGSCYATIKDWLGWWLQPMQVHRFDEMWEQCYPQWLERFGEAQVGAVFDELIAGAEALIDGDTMTTLYRDRTTGEPSPMVHRIGGVDLTQL